MSNLKEAVLARAAKPGRAVAKVVAARIKVEDYEILVKAAKDEGVKVSELVRGAVSETIKGFFRVTGVCPATVGNLIPV